MKAMDVFSICIQYLKENLLTEINKSVAVDILEKNVHYVLTVPGIWGTAAQIFMKNAAVQVRIKYLISAPHHVMVNVIQ